MTERVFEIEPKAEPQSRRNVVTGKFVFVTYAVEIEGEAPLYFSIEAVDE